MDLILLSLDKPILVLDQIKQELGVDGPVSYNRSLEKIITKKRWPSVLSSNVTHRTPEIHFNEKLGVISKPYYEDMYYCIKDKHSISIHFKTETNR